MADLPLFPPLEPHASGLLDVGDGHHIYWEACGNPHGKPAVVLHGGPGSGCTPGHRRYFDPDRYRIVLFDQRGAGRSLPRTAALTPMAANTTEHLIADIERLRAHLGIERWLVWGNSWGVTLGLAYAERHPTRVTEMVLAAVTMTRRPDIHWLYHEVGRYFPQEWAAFRGTREGDLVAAYHNLLNVQPDPAVREAAALAWCRWEDAVLSLEPGWRPQPRYEDPAFRITFARTCAHYFHHGAWLAEGQILRDAGRLAGIPAVLIHGRLDLGGPLDTAWQLAQAWPDADLQVVGSGHGGSAEMTERIVAATGRFAREG